MPYSVKILKAPGTGNWEVIAHFYVLRKLSLFPRLFLWLPNPYQFELNSTEIIPEITNYLK